MSFFTIRLNQDVIWQLGNFQMLYEDEAIKTKVVAGRAAPKVTESDAARERTVDKSSERN